MPLLFVKDICHYARLAVEQARINKDQTDDETNNETLAMTSSMDGIIRGRIDDFNGTAAVSGNVRISYSPRSSSNQSSFYSKKNRVSRFNSLLFSLAFSLSVLATLCHAGH
jgi:hypothetical protein